MGNKEEKVIVEPMIYRLISKKNMALLKRLKIPLIINCILSFFISGMISGISGRNEMINLDNAIFGTSKNPVVLFLYGLLCETGMTFVIFIILQILVVVFIFTRNNKETTHDDRNFEKTDSGALGTSDKMGHEEMCSKFDLVDTSIPTTERLFGIDDVSGGIIAMPQRTYMNKHKIICGKSGTRKSRSQIIPDVLQALRRNESVIINDPKGEIYRETSYIAEQMGHEVRVLNLKDLACSDGCNFMSGVHDIGSANVFANIIFNNIDMEHQINLNDFWISQQMQLCAALALYIMTDESLPDDNKNLAQLYKYTAFNTSTVKEMFARLDSAHPAKRIYGSLGNNKDDVFTQILSGLGNSIKHFADPLLEDLASHDDIAFDAPGKRKCAYYLVTSDQDSTLTFLSALYFSFAFIELVNYADSKEDGKCDVPVNFILDEYPNAGRIPDFSKKLNTVRSRDISCTICIQGIGQIQDMYPGSIWADILNACDTNIFLGTNDPEITAPFYSNYSGTMNVVLTSKRENKRTMSTNMYIPEYTETTQEKGRPVYMPDEILHLDPDKLLIFTAGNNVLEARKYDYSMHPLYAHMKKQVASDHVPLWKAKQTTKLTSAMKGSSSASKVASQSSPTVNGNSYIFPATSSVVTPPSGFANMNSFTPAKPTAATNAQAKPTAPTTPAATEAPKVQTPSNSVPMFQAETEDTYIDELSPGEEKRIGKMQRSLKDEIKAVTNPNGSSELPEGF